MEGEARRKKEKLQLAGSEKECDECLYAMEGHKMNKHGRWVVEGSSEPLSLASKIFSSRFRALLVNDALVFVTTFQEQLIISSVEFSAQQSPVRLKKL